MSDTLDLDAILGANAGAPVTAVAQPVAPVAPVVAQVVAQPAPVIPVEAQAPVTQEAEKNPVAKEPKAPREVVEVLGGEIEFDDLPEVHRLGGGNFAKRGSKYGFELFPAPNDKGQPAMKFFPFGEHKDAVSRQIASAVTAANQAAKKEGTGKKFATRSGQGKDPANPTGEKVQGIYIARTH